MLRHLIYFQTLAQTEEGTDAWNTITGGLVLLRLLDTWRDLGPIALSENRRGIRKMRETIELIDAANPAREILLALLDSIERARYLDMSGILPHLLAYGTVLQHNSRSRLAWDVFHSAIGYASDGQAPEMLVKAHLEMGHCQRTAGYYEEAAQSFAEAGQIAAAAGDTKAMLMARLADARLAIDRGNLSQAEALLDDTIASAASDSLAEIRSLALREREVVASLRAPPG